MSHTTRRRGRLAVLPLLAALAAPLLPLTALVAPAHAEPDGSSAVTAAELPDPMERGSLTPATVQETRLGTVALHEPSSSGDLPEPGTARAAEEIEIRGSLYYPADRTEPSPVIVLVHGNHGSCDRGQDSAALTCAEFKRNEAGYAYLGENLATWGYTTFSVSMDQLMMRQDGAKGKGMHQRRRLIAATLDALAAANEPGGLPVSSTATIGDTLAGRLDLTRIGLMGHSRGGDAVTSFIDYNRQRTDGTRYPLRGVISLAPVDYERKAPYGTPYLSILPWCDGDVSNLQGARFFERAQYINGEDPFPRIQSSQLGANHNWYNTVWFADGQDGGNVADAACGNSSPSSENNVQPNNLRLSGAASLSPWSYVIDNSDTFNPLVNTKISGDPARMGDQEKIGLATMGAFFRRYVGGEGAFEPYMTGELSDTESHLQIPASACPTSDSGRAIGCEERVSTSYFPGSQERVDVIRPEVQAPLKVNALGGALRGQGFVNPYLADGGVPVPATTRGGFDWCNPEPDDFAPSQLGKSSQPTAVKPCPLPGKAALGGQNGVRENAPVNHSYGRQLALAWEEDRQATLTAEIPAASADVSGLEALAMGADVNFFDLRNPGAVADRSSQPPVSYDPASTTQDFVIALTDSEGNEGTVHAGDERWGNALHMSTGNQTSRMHIVLDQIRVPLAEFEAQGVDLTSVDSLELRFGVDGAPASGSIQLADVRFQESADGELLLSDGTALDQGAGSGAPASGPDPADLIDGYDVTPGNLELIDTVGQEGAGTSWVVDDDREQCPTANTTSIQDAIDLASPWDTIVVCAGVYEESSTPVFHASNPVATGATNGLTITKPLKIKGAGADKVTIKPVQSRGSLAGATPYLRDGGGNVITVSRQSLGSTDTNEMFVDISGVTVTSGSVWAEAGVAFFGAAGRVSDSVVGPLRTATTAAELAEHPHGWGIVKTGLIKGEGPGTVENEVTVADSKVHGYQSGGILFDGASGPDGRPATTTRTGIIQKGHVTGTVVTGRPNAVVPQTGIQFASGTTGFVRSSEVNGHWFRPDPSQSYGVLLTDAGTETVGALTVSDSSLTGNGFAVYNGSADNTGVREEAPVVVSGTYLGQGNPVVGGPADPTAGLEAVSGPDSTDADTVTVQSRARSVPASVPAREGSVADGDPTAAVVDPGTGLVVEVGDEVAPLVRASDDHAVTSAALYADGELVDVVDSPPYAFSWEATAEHAGGDVTFTAVVTDSAGQETTSAALTVAVAEPAPEPTPGPTPGPSASPTPGPTPAPTAEPTPTEDAAPVTVTVRKVFLNRKRGTARLKVRTSGTGVLVLGGRKVVGVGKPTTGTRQLVVRLKPALRKRLARTGKVRVALKVTFTDPSGTSVKTRKKVVLRKR